MSSNSILKNASANVQPVSARSQESRNYDTALYHANLIQAQKDAEALILDSTEILLDLPSSPESADPIHPSPQDAILVKNALRPFQPADYDALIEERNINKKCGYVLCPRPNRVQSTAAKYRILYSKGKGPDALRIVEKAYLEKWCSDDCGRRALYIKVQLDEEAAWTRVGKTGSDIVLLDDTNDAEERLLKGMQKLTVDDKEEEVIAKMKALAIERGDGNAPSRAFGLVDMSVKEKSTSSTKTPLPPTAEMHDDMASNAIEGYHPKHKISDENTKAGDGDVDAEQGEDIIDTI